MKKPTLKNYRRLFQIFIGTAFIIIPILNRTRYSYVYGNFLSFHMFGIPFADPLAILQLSIKNLYLTADNVVGALLPLLLAVFFGTVFCSWICPFGLLSELGQKISKKVFPQKSNGNFLKQRGFPFKIAIFTLGFIGFFIFSTTPILNQLSMPAWYTRFFQYYFGQDFISACYLFVFGVLTVEFILGRRLWCRYICPQSILIILGKQINRNRMKVRFEAEKCICKPGYEQCDAACTLSLKPKNLPPVEFECNNCGDCIVACQNRGKALSFSQSQPEIWLNKIKISALFRPRAVLLQLLLVFVISLFGISYYFIKNYQSDTTSKTIVNPLLVDKILSWDDSRADFYAFLADGTVIVVGGDWPVNGYRGGKWQAGDDNNSFKIMFDPDKPEIYTQVHITGKLKTNGEISTQHIPGQTTAKKSTITRYEPFKQSSFEEATRQNATAVLYEYAERTFVLNLRVQDPRGVIRKILSAGDAITTEVMLTNVKYWMNTPDIIVCRGKSPTLPLHTKIQILFHDGHREQAIFITDKTVDKSDEELDDPWF